MQSREEYVRQAEEALARGRSSTQISKAETELRSAAVLVALAELAEPAETVTVHGDDGEVAAGLIRTVTVGGVTLGGPDARIATGNGDPDADAIAYAIFGVPVDENREVVVPGWVHDATDRVVALLHLLGRDA